MLPYGRQWIDDSDIDAVVQALKSPFLTQGEAVSRFEAELAKKVGARFAVAVSSGTAALHLACLAADFGPGDETITSAVTFVASANCGVYVGARSVLTDIDPESFNLSAKTLEPKIGPKTRMVIPVHMAGNPCEMKAIHSLVQSSEKKFGKKIWIVEDASHALGSKIEGAPVGSGRYSDMTVFSFHPVKTVTSGEGGAIATNDPAIYAKLCRLRSHGITKDPAQMSDNPGPWYYEQQDLGFNYRITDFQCALALSQLSRLDAFVQRRNEIARQYDAYFKNFEGIRGPSVSPGSESAFHLYILRVDYPKFKLNRAQFMARLADRGVGSQVHYIPVYRQPYHREKFGHQAKDFPHSEKYYEQCLSIPMYPKMSDADVAQVQKAVTESLGLTRG